MKASIKLSSVVLSTLCSLPVLKARAASLSAYIYREFSHPLVGCTDQYHINNADQGISPSSSGVFSWGISRHSPFGSQFSFDGASSDAREGDFIVTPGRTFSLGNFTYTNMRHIDQVALRV